jgi:serine/threonine protein kinase
MFLKGQRLGKYEILDSLGSGGFGVVYLALDTWLAQEVALKVPHDQSEEFFKLVKEARLQASLAHPNIVRLLTVEKIDSVFFMVMEYVKGETLEKYIKSKRKLQLYKAILYLEQILNAVAFAHSNSIIHRDLRTSNIMIDEDETIKITDFGTSTWLEGQSYASTKIGSPPYMAPEQFEGKTTYASDIYSIGCIFYEMLAGFPPIIDNNPFKIKNMALRKEYRPITELNSEVPPQIERLLNKMIEPLIEKRFKKISEVQYHLKIYLGDEDRKHLIKDIRDRIKNREKSIIKKVCWNCKREIPPYSTVCPFCGEKQ